LDFVQLFYPEVKFGGFTDIDGTAAFYLRVNALLDTSFVVLDAGCGRGAHNDDPVPMLKQLRALKGKCREVIGVDVDETASRNPTLDRFHLIENLNGAWPLKDDSIDLVLCDNVIEHVAHPMEFFAEVRRVLKHGGYLCLRTPNACNYVGVVSRLIPHRHHARVAARVQTDRKEEDVFPTYYNCNSLWKLRVALTKYGFDHTVYGHEAEPSYLSFSRFAYRVGVLHQRFAPGFMKSALFAFARLAK
jgi:SAM-dependent methyltransferase